MNWVNDHDEMGTKRRRAQAILEFQIAYERCDDIFDLFALLWQLAEGRVDFASSDDQFDTTAGFDLEIRARDGGIPPVVRTYLSVPPADTPPLDEAEAEQFLKRCAATLHAIDRAAESLNDFKSDPLPEWARTSGRLISPPYKLNAHTPGVVTLKPSVAFGDKRGDSKWWANAQAGGFGDWEQPEERGQNLSRDVANLLWIPPAHGGEIVFRRIPNSLTGANHLSWDQLRLGFVPLIERIDPKTGRLHPGNLLLRRAPKAEPRYEIFADAGISGTALEDAAEKGLIELAEKGCQIVLYPEAVVPESVVERIQETLKRRAVEGSRRPYLVLAGTWARPDGSTRDLFNTAVVLDSHGKILLRQRKMHRYGMKAYEQQNFGVLKLLSGEAVETVEEGVTVEEDVSIANRTLETRDLVGSGIRLAVTICEDSAQLLPHWSSLLHSMPNLVLTPVMAGPLHRELGFASTAAQLSATIAAVSVTVNSACLVRQRPPRDAPPRNPIGIVGLPVQWRTTHRAVALLDDADVGEITVCAFEFPSERMDGAHI